MHPLAHHEIDQVSGGFFPFIATGIAIGIAYCWADGDFDKKPTMGDYPTTPKDTA
jgi:hypothetical protein